jgi:hypothetical protein
VARRTMTLRRLDPWSVLKFGFVVNVCMLAVVLLGSATLWFVIQQLGLIDQACQLAIDVGFEDCAVDGWALFRALAIVGVLGAVIATGVYVFGAFLHNLIADLVGGITIGVVEEGTPDRGARVQRGQASTDERRRRRPDEGRRGRDRERQGDDLGTVPAERRAWSSGSGSSEDGGDRTGQTDGSRSGTADSSRTRAMTSDDDRTTGGLRPWEQGTQRVEDVERDQSDQS